MSEIKKNNITDLNLKKVQDKNAIPFQFVHNAEIYNLLINNMPKVSNDWFRFQSEWVYNAYLTMKDMDKYLILIYLIQKTFRHFSDMFLVVSENTLYDLENFEIEKINLIEISEDLKIPKETIRRKINELNNSGDIERKGKRVILNTLAFQKQRPVKTVKKLSFFLSGVSELISNESKLLNNHISSQEIENFIRENFSLIWRLYFKAQIPTLIDWRKYYGDLETWVVASTVIVNQVQKLREKFRGKGVFIDNNNLSNDDKFKKTFEFAFSSGHKITGINASSIAEISGIPRATVIRKLRQASKMGLIEKDSNQLFITKKITAPRLKEFLDTAYTVQKRIFSFTASFFDIYKNKDRIPKSK